MQKIIMLVSVVLVLMMISSPIFASCDGKEWELGRAIQVAPTYSANPDWHAWKGKLGICNDEQVVFVSQQYFNSFPTSTELSRSFGATVHSDLWHEVKEKNRSFFVFCNSVVTTSSLSR